MYHMELGIFVSHNNKELSTVEWELRTVQREGKFVYEHNHCERIGDGDSHEETFSRTNYYGNEKH